jgi:hypothetical protein
MNNNHKIVFGLFDTRSDLERAVNSLKERGFRNSDISALLPTKGDSKDFAHENSTKAPEGAATGAVTGVALGGVLGWLVGVGALAIPGIGPFVAAGPILAALGGAGLAGAAGGIVGALIGFGIPEYEAKRYETALKDGGMLLSAHAETPEMVVTAKQVFTECGAHDVSTSSEGNVKDASHQFRGTNTLSDVDPLFRKQA